ncbi:MAG TPA: 30S ribosomal protein S12 methylthiotransferase RimO [Jatrophihabitans sp.]|nr:30S ribosomal protein S12 methylthiotransferase RimO [Jatrophihabitans sp.]
MSDQQRGNVAIVTLGCARNEVDSEELAGTLAAEGWQLTEAEAADVVLVNTCGFIDSAKKDSIDTLLAAADGERRVVAVGCLAERYGSQLAESLPEADAVLGFDSYPEIDRRLAEVLAGHSITAHQPTDRRTLLPISPARRPAAVAEVAVPGHRWGPTPVRKRLADSATGYLKLASGCDRRCTFCAIPSFRGAFVSRPPADLLAEARWLAEHGVRELVLVSENSTSYGKDLGDLRLLEKLLPQLAAVDGIDWIRVAYLQPAELRPSLLEVLAGTPGVLPYFDLSFQHSAPAVLRRMKRFGSTEAFAELIDRARTLAPAAGLRSNVIVGFPGETEQDVAELERFLELARLDAVGVFGYSDEEGTEAERLPGKLPAEVIAERVGRVSELAEELMSQRAEDRIGETLTVLVEQDGTETDELSGRAEHQAPETDGTVSLIGELAGLAAGRIVAAKAVDSLGADLVAEVLPGTIR